MGGIDLFEEINGRLTAIWIKYPETKPFIWSWQKHVNFCLHNPNDERAKPHKVIEKGKVWMAEMKWKHPMFREDFDGILKAIEKFENDRRATTS
jgi:hypothetical protein